MTTAPPSPPPPSPWDMVLQSIGTLRSDFTTQMTALAARLDKLVSVEVHQADLRRIDARLDDLVSDLGLERAARGEQRGEVMEKLSALTDALTAERDARIAALEAERESRKRSLQWGAGFVIAAAGVVVAVLNVTIGG